jgi:hypothetical protein
MSIHGCLLRRDIEMGEAMPNNGTNFSIPAGYQSSRNYSLSGGVYGVIVIAVAWILINAVAFFIIRRRQPTEETLEKETQEKHELSGENKVPELPENSVWELPEEIAILELPSTSVQEMHADPMNNPKPVHIIKQS